MPDIFDTSVQPADVQGISTLTSREFEQIRRLAKQKFGLDLRQGKESLVAARLGKKIRQSSFRSFEQYYRHVVHDETGEALAAMIDALTTNYTSFLREPAHFEFLSKTILPELRSRDRIEIWCAACATGEEPYSIAFSVLDQLKGGQTVRIVASDISRKALDTARAGVYAADRLEGLPPGWLRKFFLKGERKWEGWYRVKPEVVRLIEFRRVNLIEPFPANWRFPVIFCRNVMIYFDREVEQELVNRLAGCLEPGGYLLIGHAESLTGIRQPLEYVRPAVYRKPEVRRP